MKKNLLVLLSILTLFSTSCKKESNVVRVRFHNSTPDALVDSRMTFGDDYITNVGSIPAGSTTGYLEFDYFETGDGLPMGALNGTVNGESFMAWAGLWCGTGVEFKQLEPGDYTLEISKTEYSGIPSYWLKFE